MNDIARVREYRSSGRTIRDDEVIGFFCRWRVDKYDVDLTVPKISGIKRIMPWLDRQYQEAVHLNELLRRGLLRPYDYCEGELNTLTTVGATDMLTGLVTSNGLGSTTGYWGSANAGIAVGDSSSAASAGQTDMQAAAGTKLNAADATGATNATPIVITATFSPTPTVGSVVVCSGFSGAGASAINQTFELSAASGSGCTLLNSAGTGSITLTGGLIKPINRYLQILSGSPVVSTNTVQFTCTIGANNANHAWQEMGVVLGQNNTNKQSAAPSKMLDRFVAANGTKAQGASWVPTVTLTLS